ncbi:alcohol dehydrogenase catalytic domain-containing protein [Fictibacillus enclensis]|uniref:alcohol dehydrogenase catalytic domain-containing protein n=1 Tax=Fictibacillus enclensis TaxID=1017270 RepID=UPI003CD0D12D
MAVGVCGSDVHYYIHGRIGDYVVHKPIILGHECAGIVVKTGDKVTKVKMGDRVAIEPGVPCGNCSFCRERIREVNCKIF